MLHRYHSTSHYMNSKKDKHFTVASLSNLSGSQGCSECIYPKSNKPNTFKDKLRMVKKLGKCRARNMVIGATSIMNKWPDHLLFCWLASITFIIFTIGCILIFSTFGKQSHHSMGHNERCLLRHTHASTKIGMLTNTNIFLHVIVNNGDNFDPTKYKAVLTSAVKNHPGYTINMFILFNDLLHNDFKRNSRLKTWQIYHNGLTQHKFFETSSAERDEDMGVNIVKLQGEPNVNIIQSTFSTYFKHSPLKAMWRSIPQDIIPIALRILSIWEHGGISLSWNLFLDKNHVPPQSPYSNSDFRNRINELKKNFSTSFIKPRDPFEIKKSVIERMKYDLRDVPAEGNLDVANTSELEKLFNKLKAFQSPKKFNAADTENKKPQYLTPSEEAKVMQYLKVTAGKLADETQSTISISSESYYSDYYYSSSLYSPSGSDGLPRSYESISSEFKLRPQLPPEHAVQTEIMRYVNRKKITASKETAKRIQRDLTNINYESSDEYLSYSTESQDRESYDKNKHPKQGPIKNPFDELKDPRYMKSSKEHDALKKIAIQKIKDDLSGYWTESYSSISDIYSQSISSSDESNYRSVESLQKLFGPMSEEHHKPYLYIKEKKGYRENNAFKSMNIFLIPNKASLTVDPSGYYISVRNPCNEFLSELITMLQNNTDFSSPDDFIKQGLNNYCHNQPWSKCNGISLVDEYTI